MTLCANYDYDLTDAVTHIRENGAASGIGVLAAYGYDNLGRRTGVTRGNGTITTYSYDAASRLASLAQDLSGASSDQTLSFNYNSAGQALSRAGSNSAYDWPQPAPETAGYAPNGRNQYTNVSGVNFSYDGRGNLTSTGSASYGYDIYNRLITGPNSAQFDYDPAGRLHQIAAAATTRFLYDGAEVIAEYDGAGALQRRYVRGPGLDEPIVWYEGASTSDRRFMHQDQLGSVIALSDSSGAIIGAPNTYDEYGQPGGANSGRFQYTGQIWLGEAQLYHYRARVYSPTLGRFLQTDPILYAGGLNLYAYVANDPVNFIDPLGLQGQPAAPDGGVPVDEHGDPFPGTVTAQRRIWGAGWPGNSSAQLWAYIESFRRRAGRGQRERRPGHDYTETNVVCPTELSPAAQANMMSRYGYPGQNQGQPLQPGRQFAVVSVAGIPGGLVTSTLNGNQVSNVTTPLHVFTGTIDRQSFVSGGRTYITTHGYGTSGGLLLPGLPPITPPIIFVPGGAVDAVNQVSGPLIFNSLDADAARSCPPPG